MGLWTSYNKFHRMDSETYGLFYRLNQSSMILSTRQNLGKRLVSRQTGWWIRKTHKPQPAFSRILLVHGWTCYSTPNVRTFRPIIALCQVHQQLKSCVLPRVTLCESLPIQPREKLTRRPHKPLGLDHPYINRGSFQDLKDVHLTV